MPVDGRVDARADGRRGQYPRRAHLVVHLCVLGKVEGKDVLAVGDGDDGVLHPEVGVLPQNAFAFFMSGTQRTLASFKGSPDAVLSQASKYLI